MRRAAVTSRSHKSDLKGTDIVVRSLPITAAVAIAAAALPSSASAAKGWKLPTLKTENQGVTTVIRATHCGTSKFGTWSIRQTVTVEDKFAKLRMKVKITKDGKPHRATAIRITGTAPASAKDAMRSSLERQRTRYAPGPPPQIESVTPTGERLSGREFAPKRTKSC
jgi:hypothetical protein